MKRFWLLLFLLGCSARPDVAPGTLAVTPNPATFRPFEKNDTDVLQNLFLKNLGEKSIVVSGIALLELDDNQELSIVDPDRWTSVTLEPDEEQRLQIKWTPTDEIIDEGRLEISILGQLPVAVPIRSPEMPSFLEVTTNPIGQPASDVYQLTLDGAPIGGRQAAWINVRAATLAGLNIQNVCLENEDGECGSAIRGPFTLCAGRVTQLSSCEAIDVPKTIDQSDEMLSTLFFTPTVDTDDIFEQRVLIETNDRDFPRFYVAVSATVCRSELGAEGCGPCGNREIDPGEECDDGNRDDGDECRNSCLLPTCFDPPDSDGDGLSDRCDERPNTPDFSGKGSVRFLGGRSVNERHSQSGAASNGSVKSINEQFKHRARVSQ